jgi:hypothetical protein
VVFHLDLPSRCANFKDGTPDAIAIRDAHFATGQSTVKFDPPAYFVEDQPDSTNQFEIA